MKAILIDPIADEPYKEVDIEPGLAALRDALSDPSIGLEIREVEVAHDDCLGNSYWVGSQTHPSGLVFMQELPAPMPGRVVVLGFDPVTGESCDVDLDPDTLVTQLALVTMHPFQVRISAIGEWCDLTEEDLELTMPCDVSDAFKAIQHFRDEFISAPLRPRPAPELDELN